MNKVMTATECRESVAEGTRRGIEECAPIVAEMQDKVFRPLVDCIKDVLWIKNRE